MTSVRRTTARTALVVLLVLLLTAQSSRQAEAASGYFVQIAPSVATLVGWTTTGGAVWASSSGVTVGTGAAVAAGGVAVLPATAVAVGGFLIGWGIVEAAKWGWSELSNGEDPVPATAAPQHAQDQDNPHLATAYDLTVNHPGAADTLVMTFTFTDPDPNDSWTDVNTSTGVQCTNQAGWDYLGSGGGWQDSGISRGYDSQNITANYGQQYTISLACPATHPFAAVTQVSWGLRLAGEDYQDLYNLWQQTGTGEPAEDRQLVGSIACYNPADGTTSTQDYTSPVYAPGNEPDTPEMACPPGHVMTGANLDRVIVGGDGTQDEQLLDYTAPSEVSDPAWQYADCTDGSCELMLHRILSDGTRARCDDDEVNCLGWYDADPAGFECLWGTHVMPLTDCDLFREIDQPTWTGPDSTQDEEQERPPDGEVGTVQNPVHLDDGCGLGFGDVLNPLRGVAKGAACALEWAFVPSDATMARAETIRADLATRPPVSYITSVGEWFGAFGSIGSECFTVTHHTSLGGDVPVLNSCDQSNGMVAFMTTHRTLFTVAVWLMFLAPFAWWAWATYAPGAQGDA